MKRRGPLFTLLVFAGLIISWFAVDMVRSNHPKLGLDLQGGLSAIYAPVEAASQEDLVAIRDMMRDQLESFGIAEPDVRVEGNNIVADLPGVSNQQDVFEALQVAGIVTLHPVLQCQTVTAPQDEATAATSGTADSTTSGTDTSGDTTGEQVSGVDGDPATLDSGSTVNLGSTPAKSESGSDQTSRGTDTAGVSGAAGRLMARPKSASTPTTPPATSIPTTPNGSVPPATVPPVAGSTLPPLISPVTTAPAVTTPADNGIAPGQTVMAYPGAGQMCLVGPSGGTGEVFERKSARAQIDPQNGSWIVSVELKPEGSAIWNSLASVCYNGDATCPTHQLAIALDDKIKSAPTVNEPAFSTGVQISGSFTEPEAKALAMTLNRGAFPVEVKQERLETVSPTAGKNSLNAAVIAGLIGVAFMLLFMVLYYRRLAIVIVPGLLVWGMAVFALATWVSNTSNFALTLAGVTGMIVAVGVTVDTYVVYFERLREDVRHGRTYRNSAERSFRVTWRTIVSADLVSLLASLVLFALSVGSVKGFALYLGLTTVCDLVVFYFFTRPFVAVLARSGWLDKGAKPTPSPSAESSAPSQVGATS